MRIGGENRIGRLHRSHLVKFAESVSLPMLMALRHGFPSRGI